MSDLTQFDRQSANRIARVVRTVEGEPQQAKPLTFAAITPEPFRIRVAKPQAPVMPDKVGVFDLYTGTPGSEVFSGITATAYVRSVSIVPEEYVSLARIDAQREVSGGGYQVRLGGVTLTGEWGTNSPVDVTFDGGGTAAVRNNLLPIAPRAGGVNLAAAYCPGVDGEARWQLVAADDEKIRRGTFTGSWPSNGQKVVQLAGGYTVAAINQFSGYTPAQGAAATESCTIAQTKEGWALAAPFPPIVIAGQFSGAWPINASKTVTVADGYTVVVNNTLGSFLPVASGAAGTSACALAYTGSEWQVVEKERHIVRVATFTGAWAVNGTKTVSLIHAEPQHTAAVAVNLFAEIPAPSSAGGKCALAVDGTTWYVIAASCS